MAGSVKNGSVKIGNTQMYYVAFGKGEKNLVVLPGLSDGLATVKGKALFIKGDYKKYLNDFTVYMFSRKNEMPQGYSIRDMAEDQVTAMKSLGITKASVLGVSQGGMIAQYIAINHPEIMDKLILAVTTPYANNVVKTAVSGWIEMAKNGDHVTLMVDTAEKMYSEQYMKKNKKMFPLMARFTKPKTYERFFKNAYAILDFDARNELSKIQCPTFIVSGSDDKTVGNDAPKEFSQGIIDTKVYIYEGLGHGTFTEAKDFYDRILAFLKK